MFCWTVPFNEHLAVFFSFFDRDDLKAAVCRADSESSIAADFVVEISEFRLTRGSWEYQNVILAAIQTYILVLEKFEALVKQLDAAQSCDLVKKSSHTLRHRWSTLIDFVARWYRKPLQPKLLASSWSYAARRELHKISDRKEFEVCVIA